jgi:hypothetical protein
MEALKAATIDVVAITAEPGGDAAIRERLKERNVPQLDFAVRSDPDHKFVKDSKIPDNILVLKDTDEGVAGPYQMVQPALVVYDSNGEVIQECTWSWKTMGFDNADWDTRVQTQDWEGPTKHVMLVTLRPLMSDLVSAIKEKRPIKLSSTHDHW